MRQETNNEIDLLLRRLSRRQGAPLSDADLPDADLRIHSDHLGTDELSAYAENVLPAAARARYTEHLADCSRCRELAVQLSASVPVVAAKEPVSAIGPSGLRRFLSSFFSPMVLRYAVPALGLIVVAAIGFLVFRSNERGTSVAQLDGATQRPAAIPSEQPQAAAKGYYDSQTRTETPSPAATRELNAERSKEAESVPPPPNASPAVRVTAEPKTDAPAQKAEEQPVANAAPPQSSPKPAETVDEMRVDVQGRQADVSARRAPSRELAKPKNAESARDEQKKPEETAAATQSAAKPRSGVGGVASTSHDGVQEKDRNEGVTRSVAGRRFRKQGAVWIDTAYESGRATVNVARGSEQYRGLVADEPAIKTIADQLDGPIIVIWKGQAYTIR